MSDKLKINPTTGQLDIASFFSGQSSSAPTSGQDGYMTVVGDTLWYFSNGNRYKILATLDNPVTSSFVPQLQVYLVGVSDGGAINY